MPNFIVQIDNEYTPIEYIPVTANSIADAKYITIEKYLKVYPKAKIKIFKEAVRYTPTTHIAENIGDN